MNLVLGVSCYPNEMLEMPLGRQMLAGRKGRSSRIATAKGRMEAMDMGIHLYSLTMTLMRHRGTFQDTKPWGKLYTWNSANVIATALANFTTTLWERRA